jgi:nucleotide-binding universal stress UspA family protein
MGVPSRRERGGKVKAPRLGRVLVAVDFSPGAAAALRRALALDLAPKGEIRLVHVLPPKLRGRLRDLVRRGAAERMDAWVTRARRALGRHHRGDVSVEGVLAEGRAHQEICRVAASWGAELVVVGRSGLARPGRRSAPGTTACRVIRVSPTPVLIVRREARSPYRKPLVGVDLSPTCRRAVHTLFRILPDDPRLRVTVMHADEAPFEHVLTLAGMTPTELQRYRLAHAAHSRADLHRFLREFQAPSAGWKILRRSGDPRAHLLALARPRRHDLVVLGTHGRSGLGRALLGSVAESVTRSAEVDVLIAPQRRS